VFHPAVNCQMIRQSDGVVVINRHVTTHRIEPGQMRYLTRSDWVYTFDTPDTYLFNCVHATAGDEAHENDALTRTLKVMANAPDGWVKDNAYDSGDVPSNVDDWYSSPDLWVRHQDDGGLVHQDPIAG